ncbi:MAG: hypothetical protein US74_C0003G0024 [Parcubacteria group bacterium GW2011_GWA2_38_13]|nr:MAG: hypothetical protein US74_C0003G0024 [Parcubacteria group bacterium GW2011_GWA2_38_13]
MNSNKKKIAIIVSAFVIIIFIIEFFLVAPTLKEIKKINNDIRIEAEMLETKIQQGQFLKKVVQDFKSVESRKNEIDTLFIQNGKELEFITQLEIISQKYNLEPVFTKIDKKNLTDGKTSIAKTMPLSLKIEGGFEQLLKFLSDIEALDTYFNISNISINSLNKQGNITAEIIGTAFILEFENTTL